MTIFNLITLILAILLIPVLYWWWQEHKRCKELEENLTFDNDNMNYIISIQNERIEELENGLLKSLDKIEELELSTISKEVLKCTTYNPLDNEVIRDLNEKYSSLSTDYKLPFSEPIKQCECGSDMRETPCYWICDNCKKRVKKEVAK